MKIKPTDNFFMNFNVNMEKNYKFVTAVIISAVTKLHIL